jgi:multiple sugar transport system substrate-binding protein
LTPDRPLRRATSGGRKKEETIMEKKRQVMHRGECGVMSRRKFVGVTAGATAALSFGTFIRSGLGAININVLTWSNALSAIDDVLREQAKQYTKEKGVEVTLNFVSQNDLPAKTAAVIESGAGADVIALRYIAPILYAKTLIDVTDVAEPLGKELKGWTNVAQDVAFVDNTWRAVPWHVTPTGMVYRSDWLKEVGYSKFPDTYDELLVLAKKLKDSGHPVGFALNQASVGDGPEACYNMLWAFGGAECKKDGKTVDINSPATAKFVDYRRELFRVGEDADVLSWADSENNRAFLAGACSVTGNAASIYWAAKKDAPHLRAVTAHALWPQGPGGRFAMSTPAYLGIPKFSKAQKEGKAFVRWLQEPKQYSVWMGVSEGQIAGLANYYEDDPMWKKDPNLEAFRMTAKYIRLPGYPGKPTRQAGEALLKAVIVNMCARACRGMSTGDTIKQAEAEFKEIYSKA